MIRTGMLALLLLAGGSCAFPTATEPLGLSFGVPIYRRAVFDTDLTPEQRFDKLTQQQARVKAKYGIQSDTPPALVKRASSGVENLAGNDLSYYASVSIGTPAQNFELVMDTGSSDLVVATAQSDLCGDICTTTAPLYNPSNSSSAQQSNSAVQLAYGTGDAEGVIVTDTVSMAGFTQKQAFVAASNSSGLTSSSDQTGILGLAWQSLAQTRATPFVQNLYQTGQLTNPLFAFGLRALDYDDVKSASAVVSGGYLTIGDTNSSLFTGNINYISLADSGSYWSIPLQDISVSGTSTGLSDSAAIIDTGTNAIAVPDEVANAIYSLIPGSGEIPNSGGLYSYPCSTQVTVAFTFGGQSYAMPSQYFNSGPTDSRGQTCYGAVSSLGSSQGQNPPLIIGTPFLFNLYNVYRFSPPAVGFATINDPNHALENDPIPTSSGKSSNSGTASGSSSGSSSGGASSDAARSLGVTLGFVLAATSAAALLV